TRTLACFFAGIQSSAARAAGGGSASDHFGRLGDFGHLAGSRRRSGGTDLVRVDFGLSDESHAFLDGQPGRANVAEQFGFRFDVNFFLGRDIAVDFAAHNDVGCVDVAVDDRAVAQVQGAVGLDFAIQFAFKGQFPGEFQVAFDFNVRVQHVF